MGTAYATVADLAAWLPEGIDVDDPDRVLARASDLLDAKVRAPFVVNTGTGLPVDDQVAAALRDACCAQVEYWVEVGEEHDVAGMADRQVSILGLSMAALPPELAPRARRTLEVAGLLSPVPAAMGVAVWP